MIIKERQRAVLGHGLWKPKRAAAEVEKLIPFVFNVNHFTDGLEDPRSQAAVQIK